MRHQQTDYGIDAPSLMRAFFVVGASAGVIATLAASYGFGAARNTGLQWPFILFGAAATLAVYALAMSSFMLRESRIGKVIGREVILDQIDWRGDEQVLDIGCGRGLMVVGAARRLPRGHATGIDIWRASDQSANRPDAAEHNAAIENVADRITIRTADMRMLPFADAAFDVVTSHWAVHNLAQPADRDQALDEMLRVLRPGGVLLLTDIANRRAYARHVMRRGLPRPRLLVRPVRDIVLTAVSFGSFRPATLIAIKPMAAPVAADTG